MEADTFGTYYFLSNNQLEYVCIYMCIYLHTKYIYINGTHHLSIQPGIRDIRDMLVTLIQANSLFHL